MNYGSIDLIVLRFRNKYLHHMGMKTLHNCTIIHRNHKNKKEWYPKSKNVLNIDQNLTWKPFKKNSTSNFTDIYITE